MFQIKIQNSFESLEKNNSNYQQDINQLNDKISIIGKINLY